MKSDGVKTDGEKEKSAELRLGIDIGSTTSKMVLTVEEREQETGTAATVKESPAQPVSVAETKKPQPVDLFAEREVLLFQEYPYHASDVRKEVIGLPRVLEFWDSCPFWSTFFRALGFQVRLSHKSSRKMYEEGLPFVASDTICFPAKLVHGHMADLAEQKVDRIFFPYVMHMPPEGVDKQSPYVCAVLQGYPMMVRNSQNLEERYDVIYDTPVFHWFSEKNRKKQICQYAVETLGVTKKEAEEAFAQGEEAMKLFRAALTQKACQIIEQAQKDHSYAVVLAGRPYHTDPFVSHDISKLFLKKGISVLPVDSLPGLGKKYVHNDICFPCQMVIGELIGALQKGNYDLDEVAVGMVKFQCDCRMSHYAGLLRKGLDAAGFSQVPVLTTDMGDSKDMHPGVSLLDVNAVLEAVWSFEMLDMLTELCRKIRPYEIHPGETDRVYQGCVRQIADGIRKGIGEARRAFEKCVDEMASIPYDRSRLKPRVFVTGELLVTYHPGSNFNIERYLERNGMETVFPRITDQLRKDFRATECEISDYHADIFPYPFAVTWLFDEIQKKLEKAAVRHPLYQKAMRPRDMYRGVADIIPETLSCGEGWLMAAEIAHYAEEGVKRFVILQPFGCLPNHICGRGVIKKLKERYPDIQILPLDLDPDTSYANVENRLQMLLMNHD